MVTNLDNLKKIGNQALGFKKYLTSARVIFTSGYIDYGGYSNISIKLDTLCFKTLDNIYRACKNYIIGLAHMEGTPKVFKDLKLENFKAVGSSVLDAMDLWKTMKSAKFIPDSILKFHQSNDGAEFFDFARSTQEAVKKKIKPGRVLNRQLDKHVSFALSDLGELTKPVILVKSPIEAVEGNHTYRIVTIPSRMYSRIPLEIFTIARDDDPTYNYLDKGFVVQRIHDTQKDKTVVRYVITNELNVDTMHIFVLCSMQPKLTELLQNSCFVHSNNANIVRLKMEKKLQEAYKIRYQTCKLGIDKDYNNNTTLQALNMLVREEIEKVSINDITLTKTSASYQNINISADNLLTILMQQINFSGEFDIYVMIQEYAKWVQSQVDGVLPAPAEGETEVAKLKINDIDVQVTLTQHHLRKVNGLRINKNEIAEVLHRASCHHTQKDYDLFVMRVNKMSLRWHDALANGLGVKIHESMSGEDYRNPKPGPDAPTIPICLSLEHKRLALNIEGNHVPVKMGRLIEKVDSLNRRTDGKWPRGYGAQPRTHTWAMKQLVEFLVECTTFEKKSVDENGNEVVRSVVGITRKDLEKLLTKANEQKIKALERSKVFMETAIKLTKSERVEFLGKPALKVTGSLRTYAVIIETAKVYDFDTKQYRCIVNDAHYQGAGYDDIASRLYALKNDSVMQKHITTLNGNAQPAAERAHDNALPDRNADLSHLTEAVLNEVALQ
jgi:hypothetical protein